MATCDLRNVTVLAESETRQMAREHGRLAVAGLTPPDGILVMRLAFLSRPYHGYGEHASPVPQTGAPHQLPRSMQRASIINWNLGQAGRLHHGMDT